MIYGIQTSTSPPPITCDSELRDPLLETFDILLISPPSSFGTKNDSQGVVSIGDEKHGTELQIGKINNTFLLAYQSNDALSVRQNE